MESGFVEASCRRLCFNHSSARRPCPQVLQRHPGVAKGTFIDPLAREPSTEPLLGQGHVARLYGTGVKPVSCRCLGRTSARRPCPQMPQWHPRVAKHSSDRSSARPPRPEVSQSHSRVAKRSSIRSSARPPSTEPLLGQGHVARLSGTGVKPVSCRCLGQTSARRSCPQMSQWHPRGATVRWCIGYKPCWAS